MGRIVGSIAAGLVVAAAVTMCAAEPGRAESSAAIMSQDVPITAGDAEKAGTMPPPPPYDPTVVKYVDPGMPTPDPRATPTPTPTATPTPPAQVKIDGVRTDRVPTPGQLLFKATRDITFMDPLSWSVNVFKRRHQLIVYYKGRMFKTYHAVFGRSFEPGTKLWEGDRRTPEGVYTIVGKHPSRRWDWFLTLNYPNLLDRRRYEELRDGGAVPSEDGHPVGVGGRIGIHGSDEPLLNRGNINWTTGCISVDDEDVEELKRLLPDGTVVIIKP
ncbi:L,D-transpeptidase family protein [Candidatus Binatus sp.]|jgi:lipoprotein-anchoring transpeptidase ErfK/SrfK|uniref:L,D-transpeptidase family protein n=1 Tax=Candidatus Binatus sp. TaxID=2811406 RepID=UPI003BE6CF5E